MDDPRTHRAARIAEGDPSALQPDTPARGKQARERAQELALAVALDAGQADDLAVPQDGDSVSDALHLRQPMRDVDDGLAVLRDRADAVEKAFALRPREELRRLVEYENFRLERERLGDLEQLPVRNAELADPRRWVDARPDHGELLQRPRPGAHNGRPQLRWHREDHVLHDREVLEDREVLVDDGETECLCGGR